LGQRESALEDVVNPWQGRRVFLTGHTGFKAGWLTFWLAGRGARIRGYALDPPPGPSLFAAASVGDMLDDVRGDIRDYPKLKAAMTEFSPEVVFHLAAQPLVRRSYSSPLETYETNVMGTAHVLEAVRETSSVRAVVCVTTDKCYTNHEWVWPYRETDSLGGYDPYSSSKACAEIVAAAYRSSYFPVERLKEHGVGVATARAGNVIGGGDWSEDRLIPDLIRGFRSGRPVLIRNPQSIRPWQHVLEPICGYILLAEGLLEGRPEFATAFNFGPNDDDAWPVERVATKFASLWGNGATWESDAAPALHEAHFLRLDSSKARAELRWQPLLAIETAMEWTATWYRSCEHGQDMRQETEIQVRNYQKKLAEEARCACC
jgi:CDP-glucose 4,6-dehydratase